MNIIFSPATNEHDGLAWTCGKSVCHCVKKAQLCIPPLHDKNDAAKSNQISDTAMISIAFAFLGAFCIF